MASVGMAALEPEWNVQINNAVVHTLSVLALDALESSHPVIVFVFIYLFFYEK